MLGWPRQGCDDDEQAGARRRPPGRRWRRPRPRRVRRRDKEATKQALLAAGVEVFAEQGYDAATTRAVGAGRGRQRAADPALFRRQGGPPARDHRALRRAGARLLRAAAAVYQRRGRDPRLSRVPARARGRGRQDLQGRALPLARATPRSPARSAASSPRPGSRCCASVWRRCAARALIDPEADLEAAATAPRVLELRPRLRRPAGVRRRLRAPAPRRPPRRPRLRRRPRAPAARGLSVLESGRARSPPRVAHLRGRGWQRSRDELIDLPTGAAPLERLLCCRYRARGFPLKRSVGERSGCEQLGRVQDGAKTGRSARQGKSPVKFRRFFYGGPANRA